MRKIGKIVLLEIIFLVILSGYTVVNAATASISSNKKSMTVGESASISVSINAAAWNLHVTGPISKSYADVTDDGENTKKSMTLTFKPTKSGSFTINLGGDVTDGSSGSTSNISDSVTIQVNEKETSSSSSSSSSSGSSSGSSSSSSTTTKKSSVATLSNLGITPKKYDFTTFKSGTLKYNVTVPNEAETIKIYATATDKNATISGTGNKTLKVGKNTFTIKVTAEDKKTTKQYTLVINREAEKEEDKEEKEDKVEDTKEEEIAKISDDINNEDTNKEDEKETGLLDLQISDYNLEPEFSKDIYEYKINIGEEVSSLNISTQVGDDNTKVEIVGNENFVEGENVITILVYNSSDDSTTTYQIIATKDEKSNIDLTEFNSVIEEARKQQLEFNCIVGGTIIIIVLLIIVFLIERYKIQSKSEEIENISTLEEYENDDDDVIKDTKKGKRFKN